jgi:hypothetical protein
LFRSSEAAIETVTPLATTQSSQSLTSWHFDVFQLSVDEQIDAVVSMFKHLDILSTFALNEETLREFIVALSDSYQANPYHNFTHAVDVTQAMFFMLTTLKLRRFLRPLDVFAVLVASLCHDSDHPGLTNAYLIATKSPLAERCVDSSVLERHHLETAFDVMSNKKRPHLLSDLSREDRRSFKHSMSVTILATDMAKHSV